MNLIGLMIVRNEAWCIEASATAALRWCDSLVVLDHASTDATPAILDRLQCAAPSRIRRLHDSRPDWYEAENRQRTLEAAREAGATHCAITDADELLTETLVPGIREWFDDLAPAEVLKIPWLACWRSLDAARCDEHPLGRASVSLGFRDAPEVCWRPDGAYEYHRRHPLGTSVRPFGHPECGGLLHLQHANWRRLLAKQAWYKATEMVRWGRIRANYDGTVSEDGLELRPIPAAWWGPERELIDLDADPWQEAAVRRIAESSGGQLAGVDLFGVTEGATA